MTAPKSPTVAHHRSTRAEIFERDVDAQSLVDVLRAAGRRNWTILADCIERCRGASIACAGWRSSPEAAFASTGRYRCKTIACPACGVGMWRTAVKKALDRFHGVNVEDLSLVTIAGPDVIDMETVRTSVRKLRRSLRDLRDAEAEKRSTWRGVRIAGLVDLIPGKGVESLAVQPVARLLVHHPGVPRSGVERVVQEWSVGSGRDVGVQPYREDAFVGSPPGIGLQMALRAAVVGTLFEWGRGMEPLRIAVGSQRSGLIGQSEVGRKGQEATAFREPMPMAF
jgi:hypothetical protein